MVNIMASSSGQTYYQILGIPRNAKESEIKTAYKKNALKFHPDKNPNNSEAEEKFKEINEAYSTLEDQQKRRQYDLSLPVTFSRPSGFPTHTAYVPPSYNYGGPNDTSGTPRSSDNNGTFTEEEFYANLRPNMSKQSAMYTHPHAMAPKKVEQIFQIWVRNGNRQAYDWKQLLTGTSHRQFKTVRPKPDSGYDGTDPFLDYQPSMLVFRHLQKCKFSVSDIKESKIGVEVKRYSKWHPQAPVKRLATLLMDQWRGEHSVKKKDPVQRNAFGMPAKSSPTNSGRNARQSTGDVSGRASVDHTAMPSFMSRKGSDTSASASASASAASKEKGGGNLTPPESDSCAPSRSASSQASTIEGHKNKPGRGRTHLAASMEGIGLKQQTRVHNTFGETRFSQEVRDKMAALQGLASRKKKGPNIPTPLPGVDKTVFQRPSDPPLRPGTASQPAPVGSKLQGMFQRSNIGAEGTGGSSAAKPSAASADVLRKLRAKRDANNNKAVNKERSLGSMAAGASATRERSGTKRKSTEDGPASSGVTFSAPDRNPSEPPRKKKSPPRFKPFKTKPM